MDTGCTEGEWLIFGKQCFFRRPCAHDCGGFYFAFDADCNARNSLPDQDTIELRFRYSFAIVGINLTHMAYKLLADGSAKSHLYNVATAASDIGDGDIRYVTLCVDFKSEDKTWTLRSIGSQNVLGKPKSTPLFIHSFAMCCHFFLCELRRA